MAAASNASAQSRPAITDRWVADGLVWQADVPPTVEDLARLAAPVLWFSPDEFLLKEQMIAPGAIDGSSRRAVYYRVARIRTDSRTQYRRWKTCTSEPSCQVGSEVHELTLRFMFYYPEDRGFGHHPHDVEVTDVRFRLTSTGSTTEARIINVAGAAHGVGWYTNELVVDKTDGVRLPLRIFVEQGKHASAPDRNGDGVFDPKADITELPFDAWGVRDRQPLTFRIGATFQPRMFVPRKPDTQVWPAFAQREQRDGGAKTYELVHALTSPFCEPDGDRLKLATARLENPDSELLKELLEDKGFCEPAHSPSKNEGLPLWLGGTIIRPFGSVMERLAIAYRFDEGRSGFALGGPLFKVPRLEGWLCARVNLLFEDKAVTTPGIRGTAWEGHTKSDGIDQFDFFYTPSAGGLVDWYTSFGIDIQPIIETASGFNLVVDQHREAEAEGGVHIRFPLPDLWKRALHVPFVGSRVGVRTAVNHPVDQTRLVFELGLGAW